MMALKITIVALLIITALIAMSVIMATVRAVRGIKTPLFHPLTDVAAAELRASQEGWLHRSLVAFDIATNVIVLRGQQDETISTHAWRANQEGKLWGKLVTKWLNGFQPNHGWKAASGDLQRALARVSVLRKALGV